MCTRECDCNHCYKKKTCSDCPYVPDYPDCNTVGVQGCQHRVLFVGQVR